MSASRAASVGAPSTTLTSRAPLRLVEPDEHVAGLRRVAGLHAVDPAHLTHEAVAVGQDPRAGTAQEPGTWHVDGGGQEVVAQHPAREPGEVQRGGMRAGRVQPDRVREARVPEADLPRALVHAPHEPVHRPGRAHGQRLGGVVRALEQQRPEQVGDRHPFARAQVDPRLRRCGAVGNGAHVAVERQLVDAPPARSSASSRTRSGVPGRERGGTARGRRARRRRSPPAPRRPAARRP